MCVKGAHVYGHALLEPNCESDASNMLFVHTPWSLKRDVHNIIMVCDIVCVMLARESACPL